LPCGFGFLGWIVELKAIWELIEAFRECAAPIDRLLIAGDGSRDTLERLSEISDPRIQFFGYKNSDSFFGDIDILIMPSLWEEPFERTVAESLRSGIPVLASNRGGVPEIVSEPEVGMLYNPEEANSLKNALSSIKKALLAGRYDPVIIAKNAEMYSPERIYQRYDTLYEIAGKSTAR
jgi:glycosyltransferase involved in cell wall biosynthesis